MKSIPPVMWFGMVVFGIGALTGYVLPAVGVITVVAFFDFVKNFME